MNKKFFSHIKKVIIALAIIIMCIPNGTYAFSLKNNLDSYANSTRSLNNNNSSMKILINKLLNIKYEKKNNKKEGLEVSIEVEKLTLNTSNNALTKINLVGKDRYNTTVLISKKVYPNGAKNVILSNEASNTDGILAGILASKLSAPILLTSKDKLNQEIKIEIERLCPQKVYLLGGTSALSENVKNEIEKMGISTERLYGSKRYTTATAIAEKVSSFDKVIICNSKDDGKNAAAISAIAAQNGIPVLYNDSNSSINADTFNFIKKYTENIKTIYLIGNSASTSQKNTLKEYGINIAEIKGSTPYEINAKMLNEFNVKYDNVVLVNNPVDAISISYLAAKNKSMFLYVNTSLTTEQKNIVKNNNISTIYYSGGETIKETVNEVTKLLNTKTVGITTSDGSDGYRAGTRLICNGIYTFPEFQQGKDVGPNYTVYQNVPYAGTGTLTGSGCNMFASACIISGILRDSSVDPISHLKNVESANVWYSTNDKAFANDILEKNYGLHSKECTTESEMLAFFESKNGDCAAIGYEPGHYFAIVPIMDDLDGYKFYVIDSYFGYTGKYKSGRDFIDTARSNGFLNVEIDGGFGVRAVIYK